MKAAIENITIEGTAQEVYAFFELYENDSKDQPKITKLARGGIVDGSLKIAMEDECWFNAPKYKCPCNGYCGK